MDEKEMLEAEIFNLHETTVEIGKLAKNLEKLQKLVSAVEDKVRTLSFCIADNALGPDARGKIVYVDDEQKLIQEIAKASDFDIVVFRKGGCVREVGL